MYGVEDLKSQIPVSKNAIKCPVLDCKTTVPIQTNTFYRTEEYKCPIHNIFISKKTFEYEKPEENLLWNDPEDLELIGELQKNNLYTNIQRDTNCDALFWNVFRYADKAQFSDLVVSGMVDKPIDVSSVIYKGYLPLDKEIWGPLQEAWNEFGEYATDERTYPDIIFHGPDTLVFFSGVFVKSTESVPKDIHDRKNYESGGNRWVEDVTGADYETIVLQKKQYTLFRLWLLGTWIAEQLSLSFRMIHLSRRIIHKQRKKPNFEHFLKIRLNRMFYYFPWESIYYHAGMYKVEESMRNKFIWFFNNKSRGYDENGQLLPAFTYNINKYYSDNIQQLGNPTI